MPASRPACSTWSTTPSLAAGRCGGRARSSSCTRRGCRGGSSRRDAGLPLDDAPSGPAEPLHALLAWERDAIIELFDEWGQIDRSHRKLAHRGSRLEKVFVSESSVLRVLQAEQLVLPAPPARDPVGPKPPWPAWVEYRPCQVWGHDFTAFGRAGRDALAILDLVSRKWIATLLVARGRGESEHVQAIYTAALEAEGLLAGIEARMIAPNADEQLPVLLTVSDNGPQMISGTTREFMALHALAIHTGRPGTPTDQAHIESFFGHVKGEWPHLEQIRDPAVLADRARPCPRRLQHRPAPRRHRLRHPRRRARRTRRTDPQGGDTMGWSRHAPHASPTVANTLTTRPDPGREFLPRSVAFGQTRRPRHRARLRRRAEDRLDRVLREFSDTAGVGARPWPATPAPSSGS
jgi:putative transposase